MTAIMNTFNSDEEFALNGFHLGQLLGLNPPPQDGQQEERQDGHDAVDGQEETSTAKGQDEMKEAIEVVVNVKHAVTEEEVQIKVAASASMKEVKRALGKKLGRSDIESKGRLVRKIAGAFTSFKDSDRLGAKRNVQIMGIDDLKAASGSVPVLTREEALSLQKALRTIQLNLVFVLIKNFLALK